MGGILSRTSFPLPQDTFIKNIILLAINLIKVVHFNIKFDPISEDDGKIKWHIQFQSENKFSSAGLLPSRRYE